MKSINLKKITQSTPIIISYHILSKCLPTLTSESSFAQCVLQQQQQIMDRSISRQRIRAHTLQATDYISRLPDVILVYILSVLPLKDCIKTSALSKRWKYVWTKISSLNINEIEIIAKLLRSNFYCTICEDIWISSSTCCQKHLLKVARRMFADVVDRTLLLHSGCTMDKFQLTFLYDVYDGLTKKVDLWVKYAWASNIKDMELSFFNPGLLEYFDERGPVHAFIDLDLLYELPHNCLVSKILNSLDVNCCKLRASALKVFPSLRRIFLKQVVILDSSVRVLASKFPVLEDLSLENCVISKQFFVCEEDLMIKRLHVTNCKPNEIPTFEINISTPHLVLLLLRGVYVKLTSIRKARQLVDVTMDIRHLLVSEERVGLASLLTGLRNCQNLTLTPWCIQALPADENLTDRARFQLREVVQLTLALCLVKHDLPRVACLIRSCPNLKQLTLTMHRNARAYNMGDFFGHGGPDTADYDAEHYFQSECVPFPCLENSLEKITINGFTGRRTEMKVVRFLLRNAKVLEEISIFYEDAEEYYRGAVGLWRQNGRFHQMFCELLRYQRASARAEVIFSSPPSNYVCHGGSFYLVQ